MSNSVVTVTNPACDEHEVVAVEQEEVGEKRTGEPTNSKCCTSVKHLQFLIALTSLIAVGLACGLGYVLSPQQDAMRKVPSAETVATTRKHFSGGEQQTDLMTTVPKVTHLPAMSSDRFKRSDMTFDKGRQLASSSPYAAGLTEMKDASGNVKYEMRTEVLEAGAATLGEFTNQHGQVGTRTLRLQITEKESGDRFFLIPIGLSMTSFDKDEHNQTLYPDLFYFSFHKKGTSMKKRTLSFCSTAIDKPTTATCFLGHGQQEWDEHVQKWSNFYYESMLAEGKHYHHERRMWAGAVGGYVGGKAGGYAGGKIGGVVGGYAGEAAGAAIAGPVGAIVGEEIGHWAGEKIGSKIGSHYGSEVGTAIGNDAGNYAENRWRL